MLLAGGVQLAIVQAAQRVEAEQPGAGARRHRRVVDVGRIVQRVDVGEGALRIGETRLVQQRDVLEARLVGDVAGALGATFLRGDGGRGEIREREMKSV